jgi:hypothetical protein
MVENEVSFKEDINSKTAIKYKEFVKKMEFLVAGATEFLGANLAK